MPTLWRTLRHLKLRQFTGRVVFRLSRPRPQLAAAPPGRAATGAWVLPPMRRPSLTGPQRLRFLNVEGELASLGWAGPGAEKLWRYNQHYFDDLNALGSPQRHAWHQDLIAHWLAHNPPGQGDGWEPYPLSLRIVNGLKAAASGFALSPQAWHSLAVQARWLEQRLEWHLLGNHLFANAKALLMAGLAFDGDEAQRWRVTGLRILDEQVPEQVLPDGGQFERSPMYHALALEDLLDLINAAQAFDGRGRGIGEARLREWRETASRMLHWLRCVTHPDGTLAHFNDSAHGIAPDNAELERYAAALGVTAPQPPARGHVELQPSGYVRWARGPAVALIDVAPVGPDYLPGHAHADTLSFELSVAGRRLIVNGGTSCYGTGERRLQERGTASHSTVQVAGENSSEVWSGFRVGRRAYPRDVQMHADGVSAAHDGYRWLPGSPLHQRSWRWMDDSLEVEDRLSVPALEAVARYHLAPGLVCRAGPGEAEWSVLDGSQVVARIEVPQGRAHIEPSSHAPEFGIVVQTWCLVVQLVSGRATTRWGWR